MAKLDSSLDVHRNRMRRIHDLRLFIQNTEHLFRGRQRGLQSSELLRQFLDRLEEIADISDEDEQGSHGQGSM